jgi:hypothetical protein
MSEISQSLLLTDILIKELEDITQRINMASNQLFKLYPIFYIPFLVAQGWLLNHSKLFSEFFKPDPQYGWIFMSLLVLMHSIWLVEYKINLLIDTLLITRINILKKLFVNNKESFCNLLSMYIPYENYVQGSNITDKCIKLFFLLIYCGNCLMSIQCFDNKAFPMVIIIFVTVIPIILYFSLLKRPYNQVRETLKQTQILLYQHLNTQNIDI